MFFLRTAFRGILRTLRILPPRPLGVTLLAIGFLVLGAVSVLFGLIDVVRGLDNERQLSSGLVQLLAGGVYLVTSFGLWDLRRWGWILALGVAAVNLVLSSGSVIFMLVWGLVTVYLLLVYQSFETFWQRTKRVLTGPRRRWI